MNDKETNLIFETQYWKVILMDEQLYLGRCVIPLKRECGDLAELTKEEMLDFLDVVQRLESLLRKTFDAQMFNWGCLMNNAYQEATPEPQVHWHFRPRYNHTVEIGEEVFEDPNFGHHYLRSSEDKKIVSTEFLTKILNTLKGNL